MKRTRPWSWTLLLALLATLLLPVMPAVAAIGDPYVTATGSNSVSGTYGRFGSDISMSLTLDDLDDTDPIMIDVRIKYGSANSYSDITRIAASSNGDYAFVISKDTLNKLPVGSCAVLASAPASPNGLNTAIGETQVGTVQVSAQPYTVTFEEVEGGSGYAYPKTAMSGETVTIDVDVDAGYYFVNWTIVKGDPYLRKKGVARLAFDMPEGNVVLRPNFRSNTGESNTGSGGSSGSGSTSSSQWTTNQTAGVPNYTPVMVNARNLPVTGSVTAATASIYAAPLPGTASAGAFIQGDELTMLGYEHDYFAVLVGSHAMGYVNGNDVKFTIEPPINATLLQATTSTGGSDSTVPTLPVGSPVQVSGRDGANWQISSGTQSYSLPAASADGAPTLSLSAEDLTAIAGSYTFPTVGSVRDGGVKIRDSASTSSTQVGSLAKRANFTAVGYENGFLVIRRDTGETGYIQADYANVSFSPPIYGTVVQNAAAYSRNVSQSQYFLRTVPVNTVAAIHGREGSWWRVTLDGEIMWMKEEYLNVPTIK